MELRRALALVSNCMRMLEQIPWPESGDPVENEAPFYPPADEHLLRAYQELDEAAGQLRSAVKEQEIGAVTPYLNALIEYTGEVLHATRGSDVIADIHGLAPNYGKSNKLFHELPGWMRDRLLRAQNAKEEEKEGV